MVLGTVQSNNEKLQRTKAITEHQFSQTRTRMWGIVISKRQPFKFAIIFILLIPIFLSAITHFTTLFAKNLHRINWSPISTLLNPVPFKNY